MAMVLRAVKFTSHWTFPTYIMSSIFIRIVLISSLLRIPKFLSGSYGGAGWQIRGGGCATKSSTAIQRRSGPSHRGMFYRNGADRNTLQTFKTHLVELQVVPGFSTETENPFYLRRNESWTSRITSL